MTDYKRVLAELKARREAIEAEDKALRDAIVAIQKLIAPGGGSTAQPSLNLASTDFDNLTMPQAVMKVLGESPRTLETKVIKKLIIDGGMKGGTNIGSHIYNTLHRLSQPNGPIFRDSAGRWGLRPYKS